MRFGVVLALLVVAGCGGRPALPEAERAFQNALRVARLDFARGRYEQAAIGFAAAEEAAWRLDDAAAIATAGSERALSLLNADRPVEALDASDRLRAELGRRPADVPALVDLVQAAGFLAVGDLAAAERALVAPLVAGEPEVRARALYLAGLVASGRRDASALAAAAADLGSFAAPAAEADREELLARLDLLEGRADVAWPRFTALAETRRGLDDPDGVGEALALAGEAAALAGLPAVGADRYLRAARNAQARGRAAVARERLARAERLDDGALAPELAALRARLAEG